MIVCEAVPKDVCCYSDEERHENGKWFTDWTQQKRLENVAVPLGKHLRYGRAQGIKDRENKKASRNTKEKPFDGVMSERAKIKPARKIAEVRTDASGN